MNEFQLFPIQQAARWRHCIAWLLAGLAVLPFAGCSKPDPVQDSRKNLQELAMGMLNYADKHGGKWPDSLDQIKDEVGGVARLANLLKNPLTGDDPGYEYVKPMNPPSANAEVILYQLRGGKRDTTLHVGYSDSSARPLGSP